MRTDWTRAEVSAIYHRPLIDLLLNAQGIHRQFHPANEIQICRLLSIKTGGCPEDCAYCPQSAHYGTSVRTPLMNLGDIVTAAQTAKAERATRFCMGAAWRQAPAGEEFEVVLTSVRAVADLGLEVCCTLGMLSESQAIKLKEAGLTAYNHNLDTSPEFYGEIITTRVYQDRLNTIAAVRKAGIAVCCGGILGMGESDEDRVGLLHQLATLSPHPESVTGSVRMSATKPVKIWRPFTQESVDPAPLRITGAKGVYLYTDDGRKIIDAISSWWVNLHGHSHPHIINAIAQQAGQLDHVLLAGFSHPPVERLTEKLLRIVPPALTRVFYSDNGSTAVEVALKMAVQYWRNKRRPEKREIVALEHAYHGDTVGAMSVSADSGFTESFRHLRFPVHRVHSAYCLRCPLGKHRSECAIDCIESLKTLLRQNSDRVAAVILEPLLQGAGGMIVHPAEFLQRVRMVCDEHAVLLIADEVLTGFGRCGKMFACDVAGVVPDLMCLSKGITGGLLPLGATLSTEAIYNEFTRPGQSFFHGHSYTGNPIACAAAVANLETFETEDVFKRIRTITGQHQQRLPRFASHPAVEEARQIGTILAIELRAEDAGYFSMLRPRLYKFFLGRAGSLAPSGQHSLYSATLLHHC